TSRSASATASSASARSFPPDRTHPRDGGPASDFEPGHRPLSSPKVAARVVDATFDSPTSRRFPYRSPHDLRRQLSGAGMDENAGAGEESARSRRHAAERNRQSHSRHRNGTCCDKSPRYRHVFHLLSASAEDGASLGHAPNTAVIGTASARRSDV